MKGIHSKPVGSCRGFVPKVCWNNLRNSTTLWICWMLCFFNYHLMILMVFVGWNISCSAGYPLDVAPSQDSSGKWRFRLGFPIQNVIILVVTGILWGGHTQDIPIFFPKQSSSKISVFPALPEPSNFCQPNSAALDSEVEALWTLGETTCC